MTNLIVISISTLLVSLVLGATAVLVAILKYRESAELGEMKKEIETLRKELTKADTKELRERLVAVENRAGIRMF